MHWILRRLFTWSSYKTEIWLVSTASKILSTANYPREPWFKKIFNQHVNASTQVIRVNCFKSAVLNRLYYFGCFPYPYVWHRRRNVQKSEVCQTDPSPTTTDVYNVIRSQKDDDLVSARPQTKNTSFLCSSPDTPTGDYDNLGGRDTESGFVTLASTESDFLNFDLNDLSLGRQRTRDFYDSSLGRSAKRVLNDGSLGRTKTREYYDRSLGRRTTKSEHYSGTVYGNHGLFDSSIRAGTDLYDARLKAGGQTGKVDLYQTYVTSGRHEAFQTSLGAYSNRKSFHTNLDCYRNGLNLDSGGRYFNDQEWIKRERYWFFTRVCSHHCKSDWTGIKEWITFVHVQDLIVFWFCFFLSKVENTNFVSTPTLTLLVVWIMKFGHFSQTHLNS